VHITRLPPVHTPVLHVSVLVHLLLSLQALPSILLGFEQVPVFESQLPTSWHWSLAGHVTGLLPTHFPATQASVLVQASLSSHVVPSMRGVALQAPVFVSHVPVLQASSSALQLTAVPFLQVNVVKSHVSTPLHALLSLHFVSSVQAHLLVSKLQPAGDIVREIADEARLIFHRLSK